MQIEVLSQIKRQIVGLDSDSKKDLAKFIAGELVEHSSFEHVSGDDDERLWQINWLKANREKYAHRYVALADSQLVTDEESLSAAHAKATELGFPNAFVTYVFSENEEVFGGW